MENNSQVREDIEVLSQEFSTKISGLFGKYQDSQIFLAREDFDHIFESIGDMMSQNMLMMYSFLRLTMQDKESKDLLVDFIKDITDFVFGHIATQEDLKEKEEKETNQNLN